MLTVPNWQPGMGSEVLPRAYRDILEVVADAPGPVRAKRIVPRIGLPAETGKIEGTRSKLKRLVEQGWPDEDTPRDVHPGSPPDGRPAAQLPLAAGLFRSYIRGCDPYRNRTGRAPETKPYDTHATTAPFARSVSAFETLMCTLSGNDASGWTHAELASTWPGGSCYDSCCRTIWTCARGWRRKRSVAAAGRP